MISGFVIDDTIAAIGAKKYAGRSGDPDACPRIVKLGASRKRRVNA
jgi:hypothetical protein